MINKIEIKGYKCFENIKVNLSQSNILLGVNSGGKSSFIQTLLLSKMLIENQRVDLNNNIFNLNLISFNEIINQDSIEIIIKLYSNDNTLELKCYSPEEDHLILAEITGDKSILEAPLVYLSADRQLCKTQISGDINSINLGTNNEYLAYFLEKSKNKKYNMFYSSRNHWSDKKSTLLDFQLNYWLNYILPGNKVTSSYKFDNIYSLLFGDMQNRQSNVGFGVAFIIPILFYGLTIPKNSILVIENPEIHLHPSAQTKIAEFLNFIASNGIQIIIETHSDHIVNGFRKSILLNEIPIDYNKIKLNYFTHQEFSEVEEIILNANAEIKKWPKGFMDQTELDLMEIRRLRRSNH